MHEFPHRYIVSAAAETEGKVRIDGDDVVTIESVPPVEFGGPGGDWSPESLLVAAVADCFILTFRAIARASRFDWIDLSCDVVGVLDKVDRTTRFTSFEVDAQLTVPAGTDEGKATRLLEKAEHGCLITNSLIAETQLTTSVVFAD